VKKSEVLRSDSLSSYNNLLNELKSILSKGHAKAYKAVDNIKVQTYWQIGERIVRDEIENKDRADYGRLLVKKLSKDMNIGESLLYEIIGFFKSYPIFHTVCGELSWSHYGYLIKIENPDKRNFYQHKAIHYRWSVREMNEQIKSC
jgi:predicted nuclease of restriction endonuclease-like (RecB) superfamily